MKYTAGQVRQMAELLNADHETAEEAARAVLALADEFWEKRASFVVVGQLAGTEERPTIPASDPEAIKLCLGFFSTEGDARSAADSLWGNVHGDRFRRWVVNVFHGSAAQWHAKRKQHYVELEAKQAEQAAERRRLRDEEWARQNREIAMRSTAHLRAPSAA